MCAFERKTSPWARAVGTGRVASRPCGTNAPRVRGPAAGRSRRRGGGSGDRSRERVGAQDALLRGRRGISCGRGGGGARTGSELARTRRQTRLSLGLRLEAPNRGGREGRPARRGGAGLLPPSGAPAQLSRPQEPPEQQECLCYADEVTRVGAQTASEGARHPRRSNDGIRELGRLSTRTPGKRGGRRPWRWTKRPCLPPAPQGTAVRTLASAPFRAGGQHRDRTGGAQPPACPPDPGRRVPLQ